MKKRCIRIIAVILAVMLLSFCPVAVVAASDAYISNVKAEVDKRGVVTIVGYNSGGPGHEITVKVIAPDGSLAYVDEAASRIDGNFSFINLLSGNKEGRYQVTIGAYGILNAVRTYFDYYPDRTGAIIASVDVNASIDKSNKVTVSGTISTGNGQQLTVLIKDPEKRIELIEHCISRDGGKYEISYIMKNKQKGRYLVAVGSSGLDLPVSTYFDYGADVSLKASINKNKQVNITGSIDSEPGQQVTVKITDPLNRIEYVGNTISRASGNFSLEYTMKNSTAGRYYITVGAEGMSAVAETFFIYDPSNAELKSLFLENIQLNPSFSTDKTKYFDVVFDNIRNTKVIAEASNEGQTITVNGALVNSGEASGRISLYTGLNTVRVKVTSADGTSSRTYIIDIERLPAPPSRPTPQPPSRPTPQPPSQPILSGNADLSDLILDGATFEEPSQFTSSTTEYLAVMNPQSNGVTVTPTTKDGNARITVDGEPVAGGSPSQMIYIAEDETQINIVVTAEDGTTKTYILTVIPGEYLSSDANLSGLALSYGETFADLQEFTPSITEYVYAMEMLPELNTIRVIPTASDDAATITANGTPVASGSPSAPIEVGEGSVQVYIIVTAEDGTTKTYILTIIRI
ncbi:cadherin-like beta sandwich domain-containing protein [Lutispora saccharofermentans]|uniref:Cadherin-like beta sandwich domain-containing protein n=1 Tax=Lutispora saccharofermentans TaxID=3024236 RepID=A0ABT1NC73_9FIRM|nr:cadherin-like beta sandwich domain-containing protein [Lutispora saccharofermentans]MCQ1528865.1 cadherin-like beta sandwich domain-containing protein [Lutispora saccharofermentans]